MHKLRKGSERWTFPFPPHWSDRGTLLAKWSFTYGGLDQDADNCHRYSGVKLVGSRAGVAFLQPRARERADQRASTLVTTWHVGQVHRRVAGGPAPPVGQRQKEKRGLNMIPMYKRLYYVSRESEKEKWLKIEWLQIRWGNLQKATKSPDDGVGLRWSVKTMEILCRAPWATGLITFVWSPGPCQWGRAQSRVERVEGGGGGGGGWSLRPTWHAGKVLRPF